MELSQAVATERVEQDRRQFNWRTVYCGMTASRRHYHRRSADTDVVFLDWYHPWLFFLATGTMLLSCTDAFLTLLLLERGMIEANPLMDAVMGHSVAIFTSTKLALTAFGILILVYLAKARFLNRVRTGLILTLFFCGYATLVCYELVNLFNVL